MNNDKVRNYFIEMQDDMGGILKNSALDRETCRFYSEQSRGYDKKKAWANTEINRKPCPKCYGRGILEGQNPAGRFYAVACPKCVIKYLDRLDGLVGALGVFSNEST